MSGSPALCRLGVDWAQEASEMQAGSRLGAGACMGQAQGLQNTPPPPRLEVSGCSVESVVRHGQGKQGPCVKNWKALEGFNAERRHDTI